MESSEVDQIIENYATKMNLDMIQFVSDFTQGFVKVTEEQVPIFRNEFVNHLREFTSLLIKE